MLNISLPHIAVQKVSNGFVVQWQKKHTNQRQAEKTMHVVAVCADEEALVETINLAASELEKIES